MTSDHICPEVCTIPFARRAAFSASPSWPEPSMPRHWISFGQKEPSSHVRHPRALGRGLIWLDAKPATVHVVVVRRGQGLPPLLCQEERRVRPCGDVHVPRQSLRLLAPRSQPVPSRVDFRGTGFCQSG